MNTRWVVIVAGVLCMGCQGGPRPILRPAVVLTNESRTAAAERIDEVMREAAKHPDHVGISIAVFRGGEPVLVRGYGVADRATGREVTPETRFRIGSVSKQFTAALVLLLAEDGKLSLDDRVSTHLPGIGHADKITIRQLLNHTSGYHDFYPLDFPEKAVIEKLTMRELADRFCAMPLDFEPGTHYSYSNTGYLVAGLIVEKVTGQSFGRVMHERIIGPLGLTDTAAIGHDAASPPPHLDAVGYECAGLGPLAPAEMENPDCLIGCGGIVSTPRDVAKWQLALMDGKLLRPESLKEMTTPPTFSDGSVSGYALGMVIGSRYGRGSWGHGGATSGFLCEELGVVPERMSIVLCCNSARSDTGDIMGRVTAAMLPGSAVKAPTVNGPPAGEVVRRWVEGLAAGKPDRAMLAPDFNRYFNEERAAGNAKALAALGAIKDVRVNSTGERGGTEVTTSTIVFEHGEATAVMYRMPDGMVGQILVYR